MGTQTPVKFQQVPSRRNCQSFKAVKVDWVLNTPLIFIETQYRCKKRFSKFDLTTSVELLSLISR